MSSESSSSRGYSESTDSSSQGYSESTDSSSMGYSESTTSSSEGYSASSQSSNSSSSLEEIMPQSGMITYSRSMNPLPYGISGFEGWRLFDDKKPTWNYPVWSQMDGIWMVDGYSLSGNNINESVTIDFGAANKQIINYYKFHIFALGSSGAVPNTEHSPSTWSVLGKFDDGYPWITLDYRTSQTWLSGVNLIPNRTYGKINLANNQYRYYLFQFDKKVGSSLYFGFSEIEMFRST